MTSPRRFIATALVFGFWVAAVATTAVQTLNTSERDMSGGPLTGARLLDAPFSADATTTVHQIVRGNRVERIARSHYYRDRAGRVRVEQLISDQNTANSAAQQLRITIDSEPGTGRVYTLNPDTRTAAVGPRDIADIAVGGGTTFAVPLGGPEFLVFSRGARVLAVAGLRPDAIEERILGSRPIDGVEVIGRVVTVRIPARQTDNNREVPIVDERWESQELKLLIYSHSSDPRTGDIDYRVTNVRRTDPPADLFVVPSDFTITNHAMGAPGDKNADWIRFQYAEPTVRNNGR